MTRAANDPHVVVLLRGVNVGRAKRISAAQLRDVVQACGVSDAVTVLNSGNAVGGFAGDLDSLPHAVGEELARTCGFTCDVVVRTQQQVRRAVKRDAVRDSATDASRHLLVFLGASPSAAARRALESIDVSPDRWTLDANDLHCWLPDGVASSPLQRALASGVLGVPWTGRNWSTVLKIAHLLDNER